MKLYIAATIDGFIADEAGGLGFLDAYAGLDFGYEAFYAPLPAVVMGRASYETVMRLGWPYKGKPALVMSARPAPPDAPEDVLFTAESPEEVAARWPGAWVMGGGKLISAFLAADLIEEMRIFTMPTTLGRGIRLFPEASRPLFQDWRLAELRARPAEVLEALWLRTKKEAAQQAARV